MMYISTDYEGWGYRLNYTAGLEHLVRRFPKSRGGVCLVVSDDPELGELVALRAREVVGCWRVVKRFGATRHETGEFNQLSSADRCTSAKEVVVGVDLLARADYLVGTVFSNVAVLAFHVRTCKYGKSPTTMLDVTGSDFTEYLWLALSGTSRAEGELGAFQISIIVIIARCRGRLQLVQDPRRARHV